LYTSFGAAVAVTLIMGYVGLSNVGKLGDNAKELSGNQARCIFLAGDMNNLSSDAASQLAEYLLMAQANDAKAMEDYFKTFNGDMDTIAKENKEFVGLTSSRALAEKSQSSMGDKVETIRQIGQTVQQKVAKGDVSGAADFFHRTGAKLIDDFSDAGASISTDQMALAVQKGAESAQTSSSARTSTLVMIALSVGIGVVVVWIVRGISTTLQGNVAELSEGADQTTNAASQISSSSQSLAQGASEQAASLEETSASAEQINSMARKNTDNSKATAELLAQSQQKVNQANHMLEDMVTSMNQINESSGKISKIIKVIDEIAFQTNILALNAAVEAARAGEAGMGFAVVADEVRSLAQRSAQAAKDTAVLIEDSISKSNEGKVKVDQVAMAIKAVTEDSAKVKVMVDEVSLGSLEQSKGIDQIGRAIAQMEQVTQTTAANAEQSAAAAEELNAQSEALKDIVGRLGAMVGVGVGGHSLSPVRRAAPSRPAAPARRPAPAMSTGFASAGPAKTSFGGAAYKKKPGADDEFPLEESFQSF
jgi:methyl-accepting chemotaxis protein/methyl-accepting chemotaxis protein-1 (serine sensor receptor)